MESTQEIHERYEPHPDVKALTGHEDVHGVQDADFEPKPGKSLKVSPEHEAIITAITNLYSGSCSEKDMQVYGERSIYDDPLSYCDTRYKMSRVQEFRGSHHLFLLDRWTVVGTSKDLRRA